MAFIEQSMVRPPDLALPVDEKQTEDSTMALSRWLRPALNVALLAGAREPARITTGLMQAWVKLDNYRVKPIQVRTPPETLCLFL